jgi:HEAT repeat protein
VSTADIQAALSDPDVEIRRDAVLAAAALRQRELAPLLLKALGDSDWRVREEAIFAVADVAAEYDLLDPLIEGLCQGANVGLRNAAREVLRKLGGAAARALVRALGEVDLNSRKFVVEALACGGTDEAIDALIVSARGDDMTIAVAAMDALASLGGPKVEQVLREKLRQGSPFERAAAIDALDRLSVVVSFDDLEPLLDDRLLRRIALDALGRTGEVRAFPHLLSALADRSTNVAARALTGLFRLQAVNEDARMTLTRELASQTEAVLRLKSFARSEDTSLALSAASLLARVRDQDVVKIVVELTAREVAPSQLAQAFDEWPEVALGEALGIAGSDAELEAHALELACEIAERLRAHVGPIARLRVSLRRARDSSDQDVRIAALRGLGRFGEAADAEHLLASAQRVDIEVAVAAGNALRELAFREPEAVRRVLSTIIPSGPAGLALAELIVDLASGDVLGRLQESLLSDEASTRVCAVAGLARFGGSAAAELVLLALRDQHKDVQIAAVSALSVMEGALSERVESLLHFESSDPDVLCALARALSALAEPRAIGRLRELARAGKPKEVRMSALHALTAYPDGTLHEVLIEALADSDPDLAKEALNELGSTEGPEAAPDIARALGHGATDVRRLAASWLGRIGDESSIGALSARLQEEQDAAVRGVLVEALEALREAR